MSASQLNILYSVIYTISPEEFKCQEQILELIDPKEVEVSAAAGGGGWGNSRRNSTL